MGWETFINFLNNHTPLLYLNQSLWRDEAFSVLISEAPIIQILKSAASDFNPPLYYLLLHFWMKIFGNGEMAIRLLSYLFHLALVYLSYKFAQKLRLSKFITTFLLLTIFFNPMLIYFAFEARMYSLLALLATASMYFFYLKNWQPYVLATALGLWTQPFMVFVILSQGLYLLLTKTFKKEHLWAFLASFLLFSPWIPIIFRQFGRSGPMWIWPINWTTVATILGNLLTSYEGTPWGLWQKMTLLSVILLILTFPVLKEAKKSRGSKKPTDFYLLLLCWLYLPVFLVLLLSYFKPLYVNRYLIFTTVAEIFLISISLSLIKNEVLRRFLAFSFLIFIVLFNLWFPTKHQKTDIRLTFREIGKMAKTTDLIYSKTPLTFFEANYYFPDRSRVFLYNPNHLAVPFYAGAALLPQNKMKDFVPLYPGRAFLINDDATYEIISER